MNSNDPVRWIAEQEIKKREAKEREYSESKAKKEAYLDCVLMLQTMPMCEIMPALREKVERHEDIQMRTR